MWSIYNIENKNVNIVELITIIGDQIFNVMNNNVCSYYAKKTTTFFDHQMINKTQTCLNSNLAESIAFSQDEFSSNNMSYLFKPIDLFLLTVEDDYNILVRNINKDCGQIITNSGFTHLYNTQSITKTDLQLRHQAINKLLFHFELANYSKNWIEFIPSIEERAKTQALLFYKKKVLNNSKNTPNLSLDESLILEMEIDSNINNIPHIENLIKKITTILLNIDNTYIEQERNNNKIYLDALMSDKSIKKNKHKI